MHPKNSIGGKFQAFIDNLAQNQWPENVLGPKLYSELEEHLLESYSLEELDELQENSYDVAMSLLRSPGNESQESSFPAITGNCMDRPAAGKKHKHPRISVTNNQYGTTRPPSMRSSIRKICCGRETTKHRGPSLSLNAKKAL